MEYRKLGNSGIMVSEMGLGASPFGWWIDEQASIDVINHAVDMGINFIDTAPMYGQGRSEEFLGKALKDKRDQVIIATKIGVATGKGPNQRGASRYRIIKSAEDSLKRLQTDYIDLYQIHDPDPATPIDETLRALDDLVKSGKVRYIGCSNFAAWQLCEALWTSQVNNLHSFVAVQRQYNALVRDIEAELVPCCKEYGVGVIPWGPLAYGFLTGKYLRGEKAPEGARISDMSRKTFFTRVMTEANWDKLEKLKSFAAERNHTVAELAIAWLLAKPWVSAIIPGATNKDQLMANVAAGEWKMTPDEVAEVDSIS